MKPNCVEKGAARYLRGEVEPFDEKFMMFRRVMWDMPKLAKKLYFTPKMPDEAKPGYTIRDDDILMHSSKHPRKNAHKA